MPSSDRDSPFNSSRFLLREESERWQPNNRNVLSKSVHFASTNSLSSELGDPDDDLRPTPTPPLHQRDSQRPLVIGFLAIALLAIAVGIQMSPEYPTLFQYVGRVVSCACSTSIESEVTTLSPALKALIEQFVVDTIEARQDGAVREDRDFARKANGGHVALQVTSGYHGLFKDRNNDPTFAIDDVDSATRCWEMPALPAQLGVRLSHLILPSYASIEHPFDDPSLKHAPQNMTLWGVVDGKANTDLYETLHGDPVSQAAHERRAPSISKGLLWAPLASFVFDIHNSSQSVQTFPVSPRYADAGISFGVFALEVHSSWGHGSACLYKVGIHGVLV